MNHDTLQIFTFSKSTIETLENYMNEICPKATPILEKKIKPNIFHIIFA